MTASSISWPNRSMIEQQATKIAAVIASQMDAVLSVMLTSLHHRRNVCNHATARAG